MAESTTLTVRLSPKTKTKLGRLAAQTNRTKSFLAGEAIASYVERELEIVEGIKRGIADMEAGRLIPHDQVMARLEATISAAERKRAASKRRKR